MFGVNRPAYSNGSNKNYHKKRKYFRKYDKVHPPQNHGQNYDLRLILVRHGERTDVMLGENWYQQIFGPPRPGPAPKQLYRNQLLPRRLPYRSDTALYMYDPPITRIGEQKAIAQGQNLARMGITVDYCYSSPASRCVITANGLLEGLNRYPVPIQIDPILFEPMAWNQPFQELGDMSPFLSNGDWLKSGYNVNRRYKRLGDYISLYETENDFYERSRMFFQSVDRSFNRGRPTSILIVGHAATPLIYPIIAQQQPFDAVDFGQRCGTISFLHTAVLERNATTRIWNVRHMTPFV